LREHGGQRLQFLPFLAALAGHRRQGKGDVHDEQRAGGGLQAHRRQFSVEA